LVSSYAFFAALRFFFAFSSESSDELELSESFESESDSGAVYFFCLSVLSAANF